MSIPYKYVLIGLLVLLAASVQLFIYRAYVEPREDAAKQLQMLAQMLRLEDANVPAPDADLPDGGTSVPILLNRVQELATASGVFVRSLSPTQAGSNQFQMDVSATFTSLVRFLARFEGLNVIVSGFEIVPPEIGNGETLNASLKFVRGPAQNSARLHHIDAFMSELRVPQIRDPFGLWTGPSIVSLEMSGNDLTWVHHLTSIFQIGAMRTATIDGEDYGVGEAIQGRIVSEIGDDSVTLLDDSQEGGVPFVVRFRNMPGDQT